MEQTVRFREHNQTKDFLDNILVLRPECDDNRFIDFLLDKDLFKVTRDPRDADFVNDYAVWYNGGEFLQAGDVLTDYERNTLRTEIRELYDEWFRTSQRSDMKRAGVLAGIGLAVAAVVTGLAVGLTRGGSDVIYDGRKRKKWEKLNPAKVTIPWSDIEEAGGGALVFTGRYLTVILAVSAVYLTARR